MIFALYIYMIAMAFTTSLGCAWFTYRLGKLKTTHTMPWFVVSVGFLMAVLYEVYKLYFYIDILNFLYDFRVETLLWSQLLQTGKYILPFIGFVVMYERRKHLEEL